MPCDDLVQKQELKVQIASLKSISTSNGCYNQQFVFSDHVTSSLNYFHDSSFWGNDANNFAWRDTLWCKRNLLVQPLAHDSRLFPLWISITDYSWHLSSILVLLGSSIWLNNSYAWTTSCFSLLYLTILAFSELDSYIIPFEAFCDISLPQICDTIMLFQWHVMFTSLILSISWMDLPYYGLSVTQAIYLKLVDKQ